MVEKEALDTWQLLLNNLPNTSQIVKVKITEAERDAQYDSSKYLDFWFSILDEGISLLVLLQELTEESFNSLKKKTSPSFLLLISRACTLTVAVRRLLVSGLEDAARPVARSFLETLDLALATLTDEQFADGFFGGEDSGERHSDIFWRNKISSGKIELRIEHTLQMAEISEESQNAIFEFRKNSRKVLSPSTHSSVESAFVSLFVPSLATPGMFAKSTFGHVSIHSPGLLSFMIRAIYLYCLPILLLRGVEEPPRIFTGEASIEKEDSATNIFFALDKILRDYDHLFPPPLDFPED